MFGLVWDKVNISLMRQNYLTLFHEDIKPQFRYLYIYYAIFK